MQDKIPLIIKEVSEHFSKDSSGHDINHLKRTMLLAEKLCDKEGGNKNIVMVAALLHDVHRIIQNGTGKYCPPEASLPEVKKILDKVGIKEQERILHCIKYHEEYSFTEKGNSANDIETKILQDADNLDAIGAIGIGRTFQYGGAHGFSMWKEEIPFSSGTYAEGGISHSTVHHFYDKLLKLKDNMNTKTGREMARRRHQVMENFLEEFFAEWKGDR